ncbi:MAG: Flp family type IVb pilin [Rhodomicrobium sp.]
MVQFIVKKLKSFSGDKKGVTMLEYGLLAALIAVAAISSIGTLSTGIQNTFTTIAGKL